MIGEWLIDSFMLLNVNKKVNLRISYNWDTGIRFPIYSIKFVLKLFHNCEPYKFLLISTL